MKKAAVLSLVTTALLALSACSSTSAAVYVPEADKVFITTASGSENTLVNGGEYSAVDDNNIDAVIFSKSDLTLNGAGTLNINADAGHGIVSKDDGDFTIDYCYEGIEGLSVTIDDGSFDITAVDDGINAAGGTLDLTCSGSGNTALDCDGTYANNGGDVTTNDGSESNPGQMGGGMGGGQGGPDSQGNPGGQGGPQSPGGKEPDSLGDTV